jgi:hypothetical protein
VQSACSVWQLKQLQDAATCEGASKLQHYTQGVCGGKLDAASLGTRAAYLTVVRERRRRAPLAQLRTGSHWGLKRQGAEIRFHRNSGYAATAVFPKFSIRRRQPARRRRLQCVSRVNHQNTVCIVLLQLAMLCSSRPACTSMEIKSTSQTMIATRFEISRLWC